MAITASDLQSMVTHWIGCPPNGYLGSTYGSDLQSLLQSPMEAGVADAVIAKLRSDIPIIGSLDRSMVNIYAERLGIDKMALNIEVAGDEDDLPPVLLARVVHVYAQPAGRWALGCRFARELTEKDVEFFAQQAK